MTAVLVKRMAEPIAPANSEVVLSPRMVEPGFSGAKALDAEENDPVEGGVTESKEPDEVESVGAIAEKMEEIHVDEEPPFSAGGIDKVENEGIKEIEHEDNAVVDVNGEVGEQYEAETEVEDIYEWMEDEAKVLLSLPITVDDVEKELSIFEGDEPMDVVLEFCRDNMPGEAGCADELIGVVADKVSPRHAQTE
eukprot:g12119.t1